MGIKENEISIKNKLTNLKYKIKNNLIEKGIENPNDTNINTLVDDILDIKSDGNLISKTIKQNGVYKALSDKADGYSEVSVDVSQSGLSNFTEIRLPDKFVKFNLISRNFIFPNGDMLIWNILDTERSVYLYNSDIKSIKNMGFLNLVNKIEQIQNGKYIIFTNSEIYIYDYTKRVIEANVYREGIVVNNPVCIALNEDYLIINGKDRYLGIWLLNINDYTLENKVHTSAPNSNYGYNKDGKILWVQKPYICIYDHHKKTISNQNISGNLLTGIYAQYIYENQDILFSVDNNIVYFNNSENTISIKDSGGRGINTRFTVLEDDQVILIDNRDGTNTNGGLLVWDIIQDKRIFNHSYGANWSVLHRFDDGTMFLSAEFNSNSSYTVGLISWKKGQNTYTTLYATVHGFTDCLEVKENEFLISNLAQGGTFLYNHNTKKTNTLNYFSFSNLKLLQDGDALLSNNNAKSINNGLYLFDYEKKTIVKKYDDGYNFDKIYEYDNIIYTCSNTNKTFSSGLLVYDKNSKTVTSILSNVDGILNQVYNYNFISDYPDQIKYNFYNKDIGSGLSGKVFGSYVLENNTAYNMDTGASYRYNEKYSDFQIINERKMLSLGYVFVLQGDI